MVTTGSSPAQPAGARRLTLMRLELGSDGGGMAGGPDVDTNGGYSP